MSRHKHNWEEQNNRIVCKECGKYKLNLESTSEEGIYKGTRSNGKKYTVREDRRAYFFPDQWKEFISKIKKPVHKLFFRTLLHTGARTMEALHLRPCDFNFKRSTVDIKVVKGLKSKDEIFASNQKRNFFVSKKYLRQVRSYIRKKEDMGEKSEIFFFLNNDELPDNYFNLSNKEKKKYYAKKKSLYHQLLKRKLKKCDTIENHKLFSLHNIRKTHGNWMRIFNIKNIELMMRMGHDQKTYRKHYGSSLIFSEKERREIRKILKDIPTIS